MAISSPLLETSINGAHGVLINVTGSMDIGLDEVEQAASLVQEAVHPDALTIFGATFDETLDDEIRVSVIATGFDEPGKAQAEQTAAPAQAPAAGLYTAASTAAKAAAPAAPAAPVTPAPAAAPAADAAAPAEEDPFDSIFKIFNSK